MALPNGDLITTVFDPQMAYPVDKRMQVDTLNSRDSISMFIRWEGMTVYVLEDSKIYILQGGRSNEFWKELGTGSGTGGTTFVGQFATADLLPTTGRSAGDYAFVGTGDDFVQYNWDNIANQWVMAEGQTDMASEFFHIGYKTPLRRPVIFPLLPKDVLVQESADFVFAPETAVSRFIFTGEVTAIRGIETAEADREIKLVNRTGSDIPLRDKASGIPTGSGFDFGGTDYTWVNGSEITLKGNGTYWELAPNNQVAFSDHLDSVNAQVSVGSDGLEVITGVFDKETGEEAIFKQITGDATVDGIIIIELTGVKYRRVAMFADPRWYGLKSTSTPSINAAALNSCLNNGWYSVTNIPDGLFDVNDEILVPSGCILQGSGIKNCTIVQKNTSKNAIRLGDNTSCKDIRVIGEMIADSNPGGFSNSNGIYSIGSNKVEINRVSISGFSGAGIQIRDCFDANITGNLLSGNPGGGNASDICVYSGTKGGRITIDNNRCNSNNSQGIYVAALGDDDVITITGNKCVTLDPDGNPFVGGVGIERRSGILVGYNGGTNPKSIITGNHCFDTNWTGIYLQANDNIGGTHIVSNNICIDNGWGQTSGGSPNTLSGGIFLAGYTGENTIISSNIILNFRNYTATDGSGAIAISTTNEGPISVIGNTISNSQGNGLAIGFQAKNVKVSDNTFINSGLNDIRIVHASNTNISGHIITENKFKRNNFVASSISLQVESNHEKTTISRNKFLGFSKTDEGTFNTLGTSGNTAIQIRGNVKAIIKDNSIENYFIGFNSASYISGRVMDSLVIDNNIIENCSLGIGITTGDTNAVIPIFNGKYPSTDTAFGLARQLSGSLRLYHAKRFNNNLEVLRTSSPPANGAWVVGDRCTYTELSSNGAWESICTISGSPGTWVELGAPKILTNINSLVSSFVTRIWSTRINLFNNSATESITINPDIFILNDEVEGIVAGGAKTFVAGSGFTLRIPAGGSATVNQYERFALKFLSPTEAVLTIVKPPVTAPNASTTQRGIIEQATATEIQIGEDTERSVDPKGLKDNYVSFTERAITSTGTVAITPLTYDIKQEKISFTGAGTVTLNGFSDVISDRTLILINKTGNDLTIANGASVTVPFSGAFVIPNNQSARFQVYSNLILKEL